MMHLQQQQQQQQLLASQNGTLFGSQSMFMQSPVTTSSAMPSESMMPVLTDFCTKVVLGSISM